MVYDLKDDEKILKKARALDPMSSCFSPLPPALLASGTEDSSRAG